MTKEYNWLIINYQLFPFVTGRQYALNIFVFQAVKLCTLMYHSLVHSGWNNYGIWVAPNLLYTYCLVWVSNFEKYHGIDL